MSEAQQPAEVRLQAELETLRANDTGPRPEGWMLSPRAVRSFVIGDANLGIPRKFYGDDPLVDRCLVTLMGNRGLLLVGEPGTAKSMLSELFAAAISGDSTRTAQGTAGSTEDQLLYGWNYAMLIANGPSHDALVPGPVLSGMSDGRLVRIEEVTRMQAEVQDALISVLSDKYLSIPQLGDSHRHHQRRCRGRATNRGHVNRRGGRHQLCGGIGFGVPGRRCQHRPPHRTATDRNGPEGQS